MIKRTFCLSVILFTFVSVQAQIGDTTAGWTLKKIAEKTKQYSTIKVEFIYHFDNEKSKIHESKDGDILIQGNKYRMNIPGQLIINDGVTSWTYLKDAEEVTIKNYKETKESISPQKIVSDYNKDFKPKLIKEYSENGKRLMLIDLTPKVTRSFYKVRVVVDKNALQIKSTEFYEKDGTRFSYEVKKLTPNVKTDVKTFSFDVKDYPGVEVNDMR